MIKLLKKGLRWYFNKQNAPYWAILFVDALIVVFAGITSMVLFRGAYFVADYFGRILVTWCCYLLVCCVGFRFTRTYAGVIRYSSFVDLMRVALANLISISIIFVVRHVTRIDNILIGISWSELLCSFVIATALMWGVRIAVKYLYEIYYVSATAQRVFIYGVKEGGVALAKSVRSQSTYVVSGFVSDDPHDWQHLLLGAKIYPNNEGLVEKMRQKGATVLMVSPLKTNALRNNAQMVDMLTKAGIKLLVYGRTEWDGKSDIRHNQLKEVDIEDLLPRNPIEVDMDAISRILTGKSVLITGAAGSIGAEIVRQVASFGPSQIVLIDQAETPLHDIRLFMARNFPALPCATITASITNARHMEHVFSLYRPEYVFHAAAYKHVPMMEDNPGEAVTNNVEGTRIIADMAVKYEVKKFVMISTDKAVNPTNVMGCSKRICEMYCQSLDKAIKEGKVAG
ncbi:MAG: polysaccharide biosynthesis protein, partial [Bacteroidaceae bacterium]|nr:polysaccharide biosynthesis protein [Bacteroidaceae bacterium]